MNMWHRTDNMDDKKALDWIADIFRKEEVDNEDWEMIMKVVEWTGRDISPKDEEEDEY